MNKGSCIEAAIGNLNDWASSDALSPFTATLVFGSMIHRNADQFEILNSDVDLLHLFRDDFTAVERWEIMISLLRHAELLEITLLRTFERENAAKPIVSHSVLTPTEARLGVHKDGQRQLLITPRFARLPMIPEEDSSRISVTTNVDHEFLQSNAEPVDVFAFVQKLRNQFLSVSANGQRKMQPYPIGEDPIPKALARKAATLAWFTGDIALEDREDLTIGLEYVWDLLGRHEDSRVKQLRRKIGTRRRTRDTEQPLAPEDLLLLGEIIFDDAKLQAKPSLTQKLVLTAERMTDRIQKSSDPRSS